MTAQRTLRLNSSTTQNSLSSSRVKAPWRMNLRRLVHQRSAVTGAMVLAVIVFAAIFASAVSPYEPNQVLIGTEGHEGIRKRQKPCIHVLGCAEEEPEHIMGLDGNVRDVFSRIIHGSRISLLVGFVVVGVAVTTGTLLGAVAGYLGKTVDNVIMRIMDVLLAFPSLLLAITITFVLTPGLLNAMLAVAVVTIPAYARVVRSTVLAAREMDYVEASRSIGATRWRILFRQIMPNVISPLIVLGTLVQKGINDYIDNCRSYVTWRHR